MTVLDAYAVIALLADERAAGDVEEIIRSALGSHLTAVGVAEVVDRLVRGLEVEEEAAVLDLAQLGLADPPPMEPIDGLRAGMLRARHYRRRHCEISLADCVAAESARRESVTLVTADPHLLDVCHAEGIDVYVLPDSSGERWRPPDRASE